jgi:hypothetical protein
VKKVPAEWRVSLYKIFSQFLAAARLVPETHPVHNQLHSNKRAQEHPQARIGQPLAQLGNANPMPSQVNFSTICLEVERCPGLRKVGGQGLIAASTCVHDGTDRRTTHVWLLGLRAT